VNIPLNEGILMKISYKKFLTLLAAVLLPVAGLTVTATPAWAACKYAVEDPTSNDNPKTKIHLISPILDDTNSIERYDYEANFTQDCDWFGVGMRFFQVYVPFGQSTTLTFHVTDSKDKALANTAVKMRVNKRYSNSNASVKVNGVKARFATDNADGGVSPLPSQPKLLTDSNGNISWVVSSPTDCEENGGILPPAPTRFDSQTPNDKFNDPLSDCFSQLLPEINGEKQDAADFIELHYFNPDSLNYTTSSATVNLLAPQLDSTNAIVTDGLTQVYAPVGDSQVISFQALKPDQTFARNLPVQIKINLANSGANAKVSAGILGNSPDGKSTLLSNVDLTKTTEDQLVLNGKTDAFGVVTFRLTNSDTVGQDTPASPTATPVGTKFAKISVQLTGVTTTGNALEVHYFKPAPPTSLAITAAGKKITVTINNAVGKASTIAITGKSRVTVTPTKAVQTYSYTVTKGAKTVTVVSNGKTLTKKFTIK